MTSVRAVFLFFLSASCLPLSKASAALADFTVPVSNLSTNAGERRQKQFEEFLRRHSDNSGQPRPDLWRKAIEDARRMTTIAPLLKPSAATAKGPAPKVLVGTQWSQVGPAPLRIDNDKFQQGQGPNSGRVMDLAIDPRGSADQVIYICTSDGGVWKSSDGGATWQPKTDSMVSLVMGAIALDPGNPSVVYAGTGTPQYGFFKGVGIYRSIDMGETWTIPAGSSVLANKAINRIVTPAPGVLLVATSGGLFKSVDGGDHYGNDGPWFANGQPVLPGNIDDIDLDTLTPGTVFACVQSVGLFKSTDYGSVFASAPLFGPNIQPSFQYLTFAQSRTPDNKTMYLSVEVDGDNPPARIFKSVTGGASWFELPNGSATSAHRINDLQVLYCQCGFDQTIGVDPLDANRVYVAFQELFESTDGGATFSEVSNTKIHLDHHAMVFSPHWPASPPTRVYFGTDGGISYTENDGAAFANINEGIATCTFYSIDIGRGSANNRAYTYGGCQDAGMVEHRPEFPGFDWRSSFDGDGSHIIVDPTNPLRVYGSADDGGGVFVVTSDGGSGWVRPSPGDTGLPADHWSLFSLGQPLALDPNDHSILYVRAGTQLFQSKNMGGWFTAVATFPTNVVHLATVGLDSNTLWASLADGSLRRTANALAGTAAVWTALTVNGTVPGLRIGGLAIDPGNSAEAFVIYQGFSGINPALRAKHIFHTTDNGSSWTDISGTDGGDPTHNLPDIPLHAIVIDPGTTPHTIIVASDAAVLASTDLGATWHRLGFGLPMVECLSLALDAGPSLLRVGTYGRSVFEFGFGPLGYVWVGFGGMDPGIGTYEQPYNTLARGVEGLLSGGTILIKAPGSSPETLTISKPATIRAVGGSATIGR